MNPRLLAAKIIEKVSEGRSLTDCLNTSLSLLEDARDRGFVQAICYGVCRYYTRLDIILSHLLQKPMKAKDSDVHALLLVGLYQLAYMRVPDYAAVAQTVNATEKLNKPWARGFVNAVLREYRRQYDSLAEKIQDDPEGIYAHPSWWISQIKKAWPMHWEAILHANNAHPPLSLRVNRRQITRTDYVRLLEATHPYTDIPETRNGIIVDTPLPVETLPGFSAGMLSVQDGGAQLAVELLQLAPHLRVLDACAAPGGKLTHILEEEPHLTCCIAVEKEKTRLLSIQDNLRRLILQAECLCADVSDPANWWDGQGFDRILLDAPCSASGVIRRHPDIKLLRQQMDIKAYAQTQLEMLIQLWPLLLPGGLLVYVTCSIFPEENERVIKQFLLMQSDAQAETMSVSWGVPCEVGRQILPGMHNMDGFYYACLRK